MVIEEENRLRRVVWAAGFFDGEGCISIGGSSNPFVNVSASQNVLEPLEELESLFREKYKSRPRVERISGTCTG